MKRRRSRNSVPFDSAPSSTIGQLVAPEFEIYCQKWTLRALIELGAHSSILHEEFCTEPGLINSLGLNVNLELEYVQSKVLEELKKKHREIID